MATLLHNAHVPLKRLALDRPHIQLLQHVLQALKNLHRRRQHLLVTYLSFTRVDERLAGSDSLYA